MPPEPTDEPLEQGRNRSRHAQRSDASLPVCRAVQVAIHTRGGRGPGLIIREGIRQVGVTHTTPISPPLNCESEVPDLSCTPALVCVCGGCNNTSLSITQQSPRAPAPQGSYRPSGTFWAASKRCWTTCGPAQAAQGRRLCRTWGCLAKVNLNTVDQVDREKRTPRDELLLDRQVDIVSSCATGAVSNQLSITGRATRLRS